jgi:hypothetical protein
VPKIMAFKEKKLEKQKLLLNFLLKIYNKRNNLEKVLGKVHYYL